MAERTIARVHWTRLDHGYPVFGEVDFIVVGPQGQAVLIE